ncbi:MAG TPA: lytic murein transglycosylase B, partial [Variovorax sp.]|nr:lytic murein transglycosylase B [Variovorax sp.]
MRRLLSHALPAFLLAATFLAAVPVAAQAAKDKRNAAVRGGISYATRADAMQFADEVAARRGLDPAWVRATIGNARQLPNVPRLMLPAPSGTPKNWQVYRSRFIDPVRIA